MRLSSSKAAVLFSLIFIMFVSAAYASSTKDGFISGVVSYLLLQDEKMTVTTEGGPQRLIEVEVDNVSKRYNNSRSTPIASDQNYLYWVYIGNDNPANDYENSQNPPNHFVQIQQIKLPEERGKGPYTQKSYEFINNFTGPDHQLRVLDGSKGLAGIDVNHSAPSVGIDREGFIHVMGSMHHSRWEYCISTKAHDISDWICPTLAEDDRFIEKDIEKHRLPPSFLASYPRFFKHTDGRLYLINRGRFERTQVDWFNGTSNASLAVYNESSGTWSALGDDNYKLGDLLAQQTFRPVKNERGVFELPVDASWVAPPTKKGLFYSTTTGYHRYHRVPVQGTTLSNTSQYENNKYAYQSFWADMKIDINGRIHVATEVRNASKYDPEESGADENSTRENLSWVYPEPEYVLNYDYGASILYAYSDDGGKSFYAPNGQLLDTPISPEPLISLDGKNLASATVENGAIAYQDNSSTIGVGLNGKIELSLLSNGKPIIFFREDSSNSNDYSMKAMHWNGRSWQLVNQSSRVHGAAGGLVSDAVGGTWAFESINANADTLPSQPQSSGDTVLYSESGLNGPWVELESDWRNGARFDTYSANTSNVLRYVDMDIQRGGDARIISLIPPGDVTE